MWFGVSLGVVSRVLLGAEEFMGRRLRFRFRWVGVVSFGEIKEGRVFGDFRLGI